MTPINVLISVGSRHGSTHEMADAVARTMRSHGLNVSVQEAGMVPSLEGFEAVIIGSAIYMGRFVESTRDFVDRYESVLVEKPTWVFASGPTGNPPRPDGEQKCVTDLVARLGSRDGHIFTGKVPEDSLGFTEKMIVQVVRASTGDYRDWSAIEEYANRVAEEIRSLYPTEG